MMILETSEMLMRADLHFPSSLGKVVSTMKARNLYAVTGYSKEQITTICEGSASGEVIPHMPIFAKQ